MIFTNVYYKYCRLALQNLSTKVNFDKISKTPHLFSDHSFIWCTVDEPKCMSNNFQTFLRSTETDNSNIHSFQERNHKVIYKTRVLMWNSSEPHPDIPNHKRNLKKNCVRNSFKSSFWISCACFFLNFSRSFLMKIPLIDTPVNPLGNLKGVPLACLK